MKRDRRIRFVRAVATSHGKERRYFVKRRRKGSPGWTYTDDLPRKLHWMLKGYRSARVVILPEDDFKRLEQMAWQGVEGRKKLVASMGQMDAARQAVFMASGELPDELPQCVEQR